MSQPQMHSPDGEAPPVYGIPTKVRSWEWFLGLTSVFGTAVITSIRIHRIGHYPCSMFIWFTEINTMNLKAHLRALGMGITEVGRGMSRWVVPRCGRLRQRTLVRYLILRISKKSSRWGRLGRGRDLSMITNGPDKTNVSLCLIEYMIMCHSRIYVIPGNLDINPYISAFSCYKCFHSN